MNTRHRVSFYLFTFLAGLYTLLTSLRVDSGDGFTMYKVADSLSAGKGVAISVKPRKADSFGAWGETESLSIFEGGDGYGKWGVDGRYYAKYGLGWPLVFAPILSLAKLAPRLFPTVMEDYAGQGAMVWLNALITSFTCVLLFRLLVQFYTPVLSVTLAIVYGLGTFAFYYARSAFSEPFATMLLLLALFAVSRRRFLLSGLALGGMLLVRQTTVLLALPVTFWALTSIWRERPKVSLRRGLALLIPVALGQLGVWTYNVYRFGDWLEYGYHTVRWDTPIGLGLYSQLLSPGKGILVFAPVLITGILGWPRFWRHRSWAALTSTLVVLWLVPHSLYVDWSGGGGWGPRLLLPIVPLFFFSAGETFARWSNHVLGRLTLVFLIVLSVLFQVLGTSVNWARHLQRVYESSSTPVQSFQRVHYNWSDSPLLGQLVSIKEEALLIHTPSSHDALHSFVTQAQASNPSTWQTVAIGLLSLNVPDYWFVYVSFLRVLPLWELLSLIAGLVGVVLWSALRLRRALDGNLLG